MNLIILIPTYNEKENIRLLLQEIYNLLKDDQINNFLVYVIDDSSPDGTGDEVELMSSIFNTPFFKINLIKRKKKEGLGKAYIYSINHIINKKINFDYILQMDSDLSHNPAYIKNFIDMGFLSYDLVVGSRYIKGGEVPDWTWYRKIVSKLGNLLAKNILSAEIDDYTGGYNMYSAKLIYGLDLKKLDVSGYGFLISLKFNAIRAAEKVTQIPIIFNDRKFGVSKMPVSTIFKNLYLLIKLRLSCIK